MDAEGLGCWRVGFLLTVRGGIYLLLRVLKGLTNGWLGACQSSMLWLLACFAVVMA